MQIAMAHIHLFCGRSPGLEGCLHVHVCSLKGPWLAEAIVIAQLCFFLLYVKPFKGLDRPAEAVMCVECQKRDQT